MKRATTKHRGARVPTRLSNARLAVMIEEATVDAYGEEEQATGWFTMFEEHLELPFETKVLGTDVTVVRIDLSEDNRIVAICAHGRERQAISVADLLLPTPRPVGCEWIAAYRHWLGVR